MRDFQLKRIKRDREYGKFATFRHNLGAIGELSVSTDLLRKGFAVFRSVSDHAECDLIALKDGKMIRVEVRTARRTQEGKFHCPPPVEGLYDVLAKIDHHGTIEYFPPLGGLKNSPPALTATLT